MPNALENENILLRTIKVLTLMEVSETKEDFEKLEEATQDKQEPVEFDKILKGILSVPKPEKE